jgi:DNA-binding GntR family transcriptional regulator
MATNDTNAPTGEVRRHRTVTSGRILDQLRNQIIIGTYPPGMPLVEDDVATKYGAARGSVRSALQTLRTEGLVEFLPNGRKIVTGFSARQAIDMYELRLMLESRALEIAFQSEKVFYTPLLTVLEEVERASHAPEKTDWFDLDIRFHRALVRMASNIPLSNAWEVNAPLMYALMELNTTKGYRERYIEEFLERHSTLVTPIVTRDKACFDLLREHIIDARVISSGVLDTLGTHRQS